MKEEVKEGMNEIGSEISSKFWLCVWKASLQQLKEGITNDTNKYWLSNNDILKIGKNYFWIVQISINQKQEKLKRADSDRSEIEESKYYEDFRWDFYPKVAPEELEINEGDISMEEEG